MRKVGFQHPRKYLIKLLTLCYRTRNLTIVPIVEKGLAATRPQAKQKALELILLYIELDKADPIIEELLPILSHKQPKIIAATLSALTSIYHTYGCKTVEPKSVLKVLPKVFGHADKNVRAEAQNLTVEFYRWLKEAMKPLFWNDLKPVQQQDLEKLFEKVKDEPPPKQERLLRSQQAAQEAAGGVADDADVVEEEEVEIDLEPEFEAVDVMPKIPKNLQEQLSSSKWKDRKEALDELHAAVNVPKIQEGQFDEIMRSLAKCMKDANIAVVSISANCVELFAKGLKKSFSKYRSTVMSPMMERLKEKKQSVTDAIGAALDAVFASTSGFSDCLEEILEFLKHKNPQVKLESTRFLIRCLKTTRDAPHQPEVKSIADAATKLLTESQEVQRSAGAEVLGTLWKIMGDRIMNPHLEPLDEIRKTKIKEYFESAEVKAKYKPKPVAPPKAAAAQKKPPGKRPVGIIGKKAPPAARAPSPPLEEFVAAAPLAPRLTSKPGVSKLGAPKSGLPGVGGASKLGLKKPSASGSLPSPSRRIASPTEEPAPAPLAPKLGLGRGLTGRTLGKPAAAPVEAIQPAATIQSGLSAIEKAELDALRTEVERLRRQNEELRTERLQTTSQIHELQLQNASLIEDHTRDVLSIKAKETQLVRARSDAEAAEATVQQQQREVERLKRELSRQVRASSPPLAYQGMNVDSVGGAADTPSYGESRFDSVLGGNSYGRNRNYLGSPPRSDREGKENMNLLAAGERSKLSSAAGNGINGRGSPVTRASGEGAGGLSRSSSTSGSHSVSGLSGANGESWKRAAEVTQNLKARIEMMKVGLIRPD